MALGVAAGPYLDLDRVALGMHAERLLTGQCASDGAPQEVGGQRRLSLVRHVFLAAERPAVRDKLHGDGLFVNIEDRCDLGAVIPDALAPRIHVQAAVIGGDGEGRLRFEECMLDSLGLEGLVHGERGSGECRVDVTTAVDRTGQHVAVEAPHGVLVRGEGRVRIGERFEHLVLHLDEIGGGAGDGLRLGDDDREDIAVVRRPATLGDEHRPVLVDDSNVQPARDVGSREDGDDPVDGLRR